MLDNLPPVALARELAGVRMNEDHMAIQARFKVFKSSFDSWEIMSEKVTRFLTMLGPGKVIGVSHSQESQHGVIIVWYWEVAESSKIDDAAP